MLNEIKIIETLVDIQQNFHRIEGLLDQLILKQNNITKDDELLTIEEASKFIHLAPPTIYAKVANSTIPYSKKGKRLYFSKKELISWVKKGRKKTNEEIESETDQYLSNILKRSGKGGRNL